MDSVVITVYNHLSQVMYTFTKVMTSRTLVWQEMLTPAEATTVSKITGVGMLPGGSKTPFFTLAKASPPPFPPSPPPRPLPPRPPSPPPIVQPVGTVRVGASAFTISVDTASFVVRSVLVAYLDAEGTMIASTRQYMLKTTVRTWEDDLGGYFTSHFSRAVASSEMDGLDPGPLPWDLVQLFNPPPQPSPPPPPFVDPSGTVLVGVTTFTISVDTGSYKELNVVVTYYDAKGVRIGLTRQAILGTTVRTWNDNLGTYITSAFATATAYCEITRAGAVSPTWHLKRRRNRPPGAVLNPHCCPIPPTSGHAGRRTFLCGGG
ncbi:hypothetical protein ACKKBG_A02340 [Auxenochlorella protothecoides x Auxenochlorella symbiontica]